MHKKIHLFQYFINLVAFKFLFLDNNSWNWIKLWDIFYVRGFARCCLKVKQKCQIQFPNVHSWLSTRKCILNVQIFENVWKSVISNELIKNKVKKNLIWNFQPLPFMLCDFVIIFKISFEFLDLAFVSQLLTNVVCMKVIHHRDWLIWQFRYE